MNGKAQKQIDACVDALDDLVTAVLRYDDEKSSTVSISATPVEYGHELDLEQALLNIVTKEPVRQALKSAINKVGQLIYDRGGRTALDQSIKTVVQKDPSNEMRRASIIDSAWNGVGKDADRWWS